MAIKQPWAWLIAQGIKDVGKTNDDLNNQKVIKWIEERGIVLPSQEELRSQQGQIITLVELVEIVSDSPSIWAIDGQFHWQFENVRQIDPIFAKGKLGLWNYP